MIPQPAAPSRLNTSANPRPRSFWLTALLGLPVLNITVLIAVASASGLLVPVTVGLALIELTLLIVLAPKYRIGVFGAVVAMLGNATITTVVPILLFYVALAVSGCNECLS